MKIEKWKINNGYWILKISWKIKNKCIYLYYSQLNRLWQGKVPWHIRVVKVTISEIRYIEAMSEYLKIFIEGEVKPIVTLLSMKKMEEKLPENFMRIHRSYIVNLTKIQEVNKNRIIMDAETFLPIGDMYKEAFQRFIDAKFLGKVWIYSVVEINLWL